jgi:outer membrane lipoprotein-sorting protein
MRKLQKNFKRRERRDPQRFAKKSWDWGAQIRSFLWVSLRFFALSALIYASLLSTDAADSNSALSTWLDAQKDIHSWSADFVQTRRFKTLTQPLMESGKVWFAEPNRFRWELGHPAKTIAVRARNEMLLLYPLLKRAERYPLNSSAPGPWRDALALLEAGFPRSQADMESKFRIASQAVTNDVCDLVLQPKSAAARKMMPQIEIAFDLKNRALRATELHFAEGSSLRNDFTNAVLNPKLDDSMFTPPVPPDFKVVEPLKQ